ncbi:hypothetical protein TNCV_470611 [Trichonephila clavipes]|nr:hypothetical protein TNCV_470611 [Trichonephila clavipes]
MITNFFIPELNNHDVQELWFQQDGATCHTARATIDLLKDTFGDHLISRFGPVNWISFTPNAAVLFVGVAIQPEVRFIAKQNSLMKIARATIIFEIKLHNLKALFRRESIHDELPNQTENKNHLTSVKSVTILEIPCLNCGGGDRWWCHLSSLREFHRSKSYCHLYGA